MVDQNKTIVLSGTEQVAYARLASLKGALKLESKGLKFRGGAVRPKLAAEFGLKARDPHQKFIDVIQAKMDKMLAKKQ